MSTQDDTIRLISFEVEKASEDSDANFSLSWQVANAAQVTIEGPGIGTAGLNRATIYDGTGELHVQTSETKANYKLTAAPDPQRLIHGQCEIDLNNLKPTEENAAADSDDSSAAAEKIDPDATAVTQLELNGIEISKRGICYVDFESKQNLEWAYQNGDEAILYVKGDVPGVTEGPVNSKGSAAVGPFSGENGGTLELLITKPRRDSRTLDIRINRARIKVINAEATAGSKATLSWEVESAKAVEILPFKETSTPVPTNPGFKDSMTFEVESGHDYQFKVQATSSDGKKSHKIMTATVV